MAQSIAALQIVEEEIRQKALRHHASSGVFVQSEEGVLHRVKCGTVFRA
jgi:hypothetical protein